MHRMHEPPRLNLIALPESVFHLGSCDSEQLSTRTERHQVVRTLSRHLRSAIHYGFWLAAKETWIGRLKAVVNEIADGAGFYRITY